MGWALAVCWAAMPSSGFASVAESGRGMASAVMQPVVAEAEAPLGAISGTVSDPSGAKIAGALVHVLNGALERDTTTNEMGHFNLPLPPGTYAVTIKAVGFRTYDTKIVLKEDAAHAGLNVRLEIDAAAEEITVPADQKTDPSADSDKSAVVFKGEQLKEFSDNDSVFQREIIALAGGSPGRPPQILVDGFSSGRFPPKNTIQEIRLNRNSYSAAYDAFGTSVEIFTKPGTDALHGDFAASGNDDVFNSANPYSSVQPPYHTLNVDGDLSGPIDKKTAYFVSGTYNDLQNNAIVDAIDPALLTPLSEAVPAPQKTQTYSGRLDRQVTLANIFTARYEYNNVSFNNSGVGLLVLPSEGLNTSTSTQTLQLADTQAIGAKMISQAHFQYIRTRQEQNPVSTGTAIVVEGVFNGGGSPAQKLSDNTDRYEFQELFTVEHGAHFLRMGGRYRLIRDANFTTASYNGQFTFPSLAAYQLALQGETPAQIAAAGLGTTQYNVTAGEPSATVVTGDLGVFAEDEWKIRKNFTLTYGLRIESQSAVPDHFDPAPRLGVTWAIRRKKGQPVVTLRGGGGIFYDRFAAANILTAIRQQSGTLQPSYDIENPGFYQQFLNAPPPAALLGSMQPTLYNIDPHLRTEYSIIGGVTAVRSLGKNGSITAKYTWFRGDHQYLSRNINAPLPGTYNPADPTSGVRPLGGTQNIYQFDSGGIGKVQLFTVNSSWKFGKWGSGFVYYSYQQNRADEGTPTTFASNSYDLAQDYGRSAQYAQQLAVSAMLNLPLGIGGNLFGTTQGGAPFNITTGTDLNGDTIYNDRPAFATNTNANSIIYKTRFGTFDANPQPGEKIIPINDGNSPNLTLLSVSLDRSFKVGPRPAASAAAPGAAASNTPAPPPDRPYTLGFTVEADNIFNHVNPGQPVGVLNSPLFGQSISLNPTLSNNSSANRTIVLRATFSF
jgi:Carboxypeptidase regulatory-like domain